MKTLIAGEVSLRLIAKWLLIAVAVIGCGTAIESVAKAQQRRGTVQNHQRTIRYRTDGSFNATENRIIHQAVGIVGSRFLDPRMFAYAKARYRRTFTMHNFRTVAQFESWFTRTQLPALRLRGFPTLTITGFSERSNTMGRARVGLVRTTYANGRYSVSGQFVVGLNRYNLGNAANSLGRDVNYWASVIAHEMLHNLGHQHPEGQYDQLFIREYQNAIRYNAVGVPAIVNRSGPRTGGSNIRQFSTRYLRLRNATREAVTVWVKFQVPGNRSWTWYPASSAIAYRLAPGQSLVAAVKRRPISAARVQLYARGNSGRQWKSHWTNGYWLARTTYRSQSRQTMTMTLR